VIRLEVDLVPVFEKPYVHRPVDSFLLSFRTPGVLQLLKIGVIAAGRSVIGSSKGRMCGIEVVNG